MAKGISCKADVGGKSNQISIREAVAGIGVNVTFSAASG